jgi:hypothetical protein
LNETLDPLEFLELEEELSLSLSKFFNHCLMSGGPG